MLGGLCYLSHCCRGGLRLLLSSKDSGTSDGKGMGVIGRESRGVGRDDTLAARCATGKATRREEKSRFATRGDCRLRSTGELSRNLSLGPNSGTLWDGLNLFIKLHARAEWPEKQGSMEGSQPLGHS